MKYKLIKENFDRSMSRLMEVVAEDDKITSQLSPRSKAAYSKMARRYLKSDGSVNTQRLFSDEAKRSTLYVTGADILAKELMDLGVDIDLQGVDRENLERGDIEEIYVVITQILHSISKLKSAPEPLGKEDDLEPGLPEPEELEKSKSEDSELERLLRRKRSLENRLAYYGDDRFPSGPFASSYEDSEELSKINKQIAKLKKTSIG